MTDSNEQPSKKSGSPPKEDVTQTQPEKYEDTKNTEVPAKIEQKTHPPEAVVGDLVALLSELADRRKNDEPAPGKLSAFGVEIGGWGALVALIVSLVTAGWTLYGTFVARPNPSVEGPTILNLFCSRDSYDKRLNRHVCDDGAHLVVRAGPFLFVNRSLAANSFLVSDGRLQVIFKGSNPPREKIDLRWQFFSDATNADIEQRSVAPIEVASRRPQSEEIEFFPRRKFNSQRVIEFIDKYDFMQFQEHVASGLIDSLTLRFEFTLTPGNENLSTECNLTLGPDFIRNAKSKQFCYFSRDCNEAQ